MQKLARFLARAALPCAIGLACPAARGEPGDSATELSSNRGRPTVVLDRIQFPSIPKAATYTRHLKQVLKREARRADWGAGRGHRIEYRFTVDQLQIVPDKNVLRVKCAALGRLPNGRSARSKLSYGGDPRNQTETVKRVLEIVARGVVTRLAELERERRGVD